MEDFGGRSVGTLALIVADASNLLERCGRRWFRALIAPVSPHSLTIVGSTFREVIRSYEFEGKLPLRMR
jgi:hypothetical protein